MAGPMGNEARFREDVALVLESKLILPKDFRLRCNQKILFDLTVKQGDKFHPEFGFLDQDIVIAKELRVEGSISEYFRRTTKRETLWVPHIIIETKYRDVSSHTLMAYSHIASSIKSVFSAYPVSFYLLLRYCNEGYQKLLRHGTGFDRIVPLEAISSNQKTPKYKKGDLQTHLKRNSHLKKQFHRFLKLLQSDLVHKKRIMDSNSA